ncbi:bifunctional 3,4-dihydroxy-2-butanone-4-phosphate synthase/GTP cyclohydrolase II [bacterium]|nr:bifunctional 3,4-dihydroxy-2-butanone-4-phosphate synthase/GTP cyclohydrolase II [bacterium]
MSEIDFKFNSIEEAIEDFKQGKPLIVADDTSRENEGDLICSAQFATPDMINFMSKEARGLICLAISSKIAQKLDLPQMVEQNTEQMKTAFTLSIDASEKYGVTTGISAYDRAKTIEVAIAPDAQPSDLRRPGHMFPCVSRNGGVLQRAGHTETVVDLARLSGHIPAGVMCEIMNEDGSMARRDELMKFAQKHNIKFISVEDLIAYRLKQEKIISRDAVADLPTQFGNFKIYGYTNTLTGDEHIAIVKDDNSDKTPIIRVHSECFTGDVLHSLRCDCNDQLHQALRMIEEYGKGAVVYIRNHEGRGIGLVNKIKAYALQDKGQDTIEANLSLGFPVDLRDYGAGAQIILDLGFNNFNLITNNPKKIVGLKGYGLNIQEIINLKSDINEFNKRYLDTKKDKMHHML